MKNRTNVDPLDIDLLTPSSVLDWDVKHSFISQFNHMESLRTVRVQDMVFHPQEREMASLFGREQLQGLCYLVLHYHLHIRGNIGGWVFFRQKTRRMLFSSGNK